MIWYLIIGLILVLLTLFVTVYINSRLFVYIRGLEKKVAEQIQKNENMYQSLKEIVADDFLMTDGRLKKFRMQEEKEKIYNGIRVEDTEVEF